MTVVREETFGPVSPIITFSNIDEAIHISNGTAFGFSSGICNNRMDDAMRLATESRRRQYVGGTRLPEPAKACSQGSAWPSQARQATPVHLSLLARLHGLVPCAAH
jgi:hypothetical protein